MKNANRFILILVLFAVCLSAFSICCYAEDAKPSTGAVKFSSNQLGEPKIDIQSMIRSKATKETVDWHYQRFTISRPDVYRFDTSVYLIEYNVSTEYWHNVTEMNYQSLSDAIDKSYPTVYIPLFGDVADSKDQVIQDRVIGHIKLAYNWFKSDYTFGMTLYNIESSDFKDKKNVWFYEDILEYLDRSDTVAEQVFMIRYPSSLADGHQKVAIIQTANDPIILDVSNSLGGTSASDTKNVIAYTLAEYRTRRLEVEKELYKTIDGWENTHVTSNQNDSTGERIAAVLAVTSAVGALVFVLVKTRSRSSPQ